MEIKVASIKDWEELKIFYDKIYRKNHPLQNKLFWEWQYADEKFGRSFIAISDDGKIVGHVGANFGGGYGWIINVYLEEEFRGQGIIGNLYKLARNYFPLAATAANDAGLGLYRNMNWYRYMNLQRYIIINPEFKLLSVDELFAPIKNVKIFHKPTGHFWEQPTLNSLITTEGSTAIVQNNVGGLRVVDINNPAEVVKFAWQNNYKWIDYITSWNDKKCRVLEEEGWVLDYKSIIPWRLDPVVKGYMCDISYLSEDIVSKNFIVHRSFSDHGRVGSIKEV